MNKANGGKAIPAELFTAGEYQADEKAGVPRLSWRV